MVLEEGLKDIDVNAENLTAFFDINYIDKLSDYFQNFQERTVPAEQISPTPITPKEPPGAHKK
jgi:hypothetical protein